MNSTGFLLLGVLLLFFIEQSLQFRNTYSYTSGSNQFLQTGLNQVSSNIHDNLLGESLEAIKDVSIAEYHTLFLSSSGILFGAGSNKAGQLSDISFETSFSFKIVGGHEVKKACAMGSDKNVGSGSTVYLTVDNQLFSVGSNRFGNLGIGKVTNQNHNEIENFLSSFFSSSFFF
mgnify:CR=1 FL=1